MTAAMLVFGVAGCSSAVSRNDVEKAIKSKLTTVLSSHKVSDVTCNNDLSAKVGASTKRTTTIDGNTCMSSAVVTQVGVSKVHYSIKTSQSYTTPAGSASAPALAYPRCTRRGRRKDPAALTVPNLSWRSLTGDGRRQLQPRADVSRTGSIRDAGDCGGVP